MGQPTWYLEGFERLSNTVVRVALVTLPFKVGRGASCDLTLQSRMVSQLHAEFLLRDGGLWLRDNQSTNGTFVNGKRLQAQRQIKAGDIIHFAELEFRINENPQAVLGVASQTLRIADGKIHGTQYRELREMLRTSAVQTLLQPIISLQDKSVLGYEVLGQGLLEGALMAPTDLFLMADTLGLATELSVLFRDKGLEQANSVSNAAELFVNTHPVELRDHQTLLESLTSLRNRYPTRSINLEVHESAITDPATLRTLSQQLSKIGIHLAFDDFGIGQARLLELADVAPRYIKFDVSLIRNLHRVSQKRRDVVKTLVRLALDMDIVTIAEGIEKAGEAKICAEFGFQFGQGFHFGHPQAPTAFIDN